MRIRESNSNDFLKNNSEIKGILNYYNLQNQNTNTPIYSLNCQSANNLFLFDDDSEYFQSENDTNAFIRFEFKSKFFVPTSYKIKTTSHNYYTGHFSLLKYTYY